MTTPAHRDGTAEQHQKWENHSQNTWNSKNKPAMGGIMEFGSLFAGIGGFDLGLEQTGMTCKWQVEIDDFCNKVLEKHWPNVERFRDVRECGKHNLRSVDLICGGFPCQPHSLSGKQKGAADDRDLWPEYFRIVNDLRPRWVIGENVPGIKHTILDQVLSDLEGIGYEIGTFVIPACAVNAPHRRDRVWIIAHAPGTDRRHNPARSGSESQRGIPTPQPKSIRPENGSAWANDIASACGAVSNANGQGREKRESQRGDTCEKQPALVGADRWLSEPRMGRVVDGFSKRMDRRNHRLRLQALGNAVVPQIAEWIGKTILQVEYQ